MLPIIKATYANSYYPRERKAENKKREFTQTG